MKYIFLLLVTFFFIGCSTKEVIKKEPFKLPYFNKDKANLYILNKQDLFTFSRESVIINLDCNNSSYGAIVNTIQFAYFPLEHGSCSLFVNNYDNLKAAFGRRDGQKLNLNLEAGKIYFVDIDLSMDAKSWFKFVFTPVWMDMEDPLIESSIKNDSFEKLEDIINFKPMLGVKRLYPPESSYF